MTVDEAYHHEMKLFRSFAGRGDIAGSWHHLERAHILSQRFALRHIFVHIVMAEFAIRVSDWREFFAQIPRVLLAAPGSMMGHAPIGNTGRSNIGIFEPMEIPEDLRSILKSQGPRKA